MVKKESIERGNKMTFCHFLKKRVISCPFSENGLYY